jgi:hypothetical protein
MKTFTLEEIESAIWDQGGFCANCGEYYDSIEPDAREYHCYCCEENKVYGAEELLIMGLVE